MKGTPISQIDGCAPTGSTSPSSRQPALRSFTQVFRDGFHADMHPGNIFVAADGRYIALDFGIVGTLTDSDKNYLAQNFLPSSAATTNGWPKPILNPAGRQKKPRVDEFEAAIRAVCEPIFDRPLGTFPSAKFCCACSDLAPLSRNPTTGHAAKTLLNIEGLGRQLDPELDLWKTAKP